MSNRNGEEDLTGKIRLEVQRESEGFFDTAERFIKRVKMLGMVFVFIAGGGYSVSLWMASVAHRDDVETLRAQLEMITTKLTRIEGELEILKREKR